MFFSASLPVTSKEWCGSRATRSSICAAITSAERGVWATAVREKGRVAPASKTPPADSRLRLLISAGPVSPAATVRLRSFA